MDYLRDVRMHALASLLQYKAQFLSLLQPLGSYWRTPADAGRAG